MVFNWYNFFPKDTGKTRKEKETDRRNRRKNGKLFGKTDFGSYDK